MKSILRLYFPQMLLLCALTWLVGCGEHSRHILSSSQLRIEVSGTPLTAFSVTYAFGTWKGSVATSASREPQVVLDASVSGDGTVELVKKGPAEELILDVYEGKAPVAHLVVPKGIQAGRAVRVGAAWRTEAL